MVGLDGDDRKYRKLRSKDYYEAKAAVEAETQRQEYCLVCKRELEPVRKNWNGYCFQCFNEPL